MTTGLYFSKKLLEVGFIFIFPVIHLSLFKEISEKYLNIKFNYNFLVVDKFFIAVIYFRKSCNVFQIS